MILQTDSSPVFRQQARAWLTLTPPSASGAPRLFQAGGRRVVLVETVNCPDRLTLRETLLVRGDFQCGAGSRFLAPVYVGGHALIGKGSEVEAVCAEGGLAIGLHAKVSRWADARGRVDLRSGAFASEVVSDTSIHLAVDAAAGALFAPEIATQGRDAQLAEGPPAGNYIDIPPPCSGDLPELGGVRGFRQDRLTPLGAETWVYDGSLNCPWPVLLKSKLVVRGSFTCPPGSLIEDDIKAGVSIRLGEGSISRGRLSSRGDLTLEEDCLFEGSLRAGMSLRLCSGVRGFRQNGPVDAHSQQKLILEPNVVVRGRLSAGHGVVATQPAVEGGLDLLLAES